MIEYRIMIRNGGEIKINLLKRRAGWRAGMAVPDGNAQRARRHAADVRDMSPVEYNKGSTD
jgi:hypothetical protein